MLYIYISLSIYIYIYIYNTLYIQELAQKLDRSGSHAAVLGD